MQAKHLIAMLTAAAVAHSDSVNESCQFLAIVRKNVLHGLCNTPPNSKLPNDFSQLDLNRCVGVDIEGNTTTMIWKPEGNALKVLCSHCKLQRPSVQRAGGHFDSVMPPPPVDLLCRCTNIHTDKTEFSSLDINEGIYVNEEGRLAC